MGDTCEWIAVLAKEIATVFGFHHEPIGLDISLLIINMSIMNSKCRDSTIYN
jgi:hypothetical protein